MGKNIKQVVLFLVILLIAVCLLQYSIDYCYKRRVSNKFTKLINNQTDADVMIFGSSVAYHQFNAPVIQNIIGTATYNMGWPGMFFVQYNGLIKQYLSYQKHCKCIVIACDFDNLGKTELITRPDLFYAYLSNEYVFKSLLEIEHNKIFHARYLPGYKLTLLNKPFYTDMLLGSHSSDSLSGYEPLDTIWEPTRSLKPFNTRYDDDVFAAFKATVDEISAKGIKVVMVIPPVYKEGYNLIQNAAMIKSKYSSLIKQNVYFLDYTSDSICDTKSYFHNYTHLNGTGATLFSHTFAQDLSKILHD